MYTKTERFVRAIRPPTPAISDNPLSWIKPAEHLMKYHDKIITLTDGQLTAEAARYTHSFRTSMILFGLNTGGVLASAALFGHIHATNMELFLFNYPIIIFNVVRGITREYEKEVLHLEQQHRRDRSYR